MRRCCLLLLVFCGAAPALAQWQPAGDRIMTRWGKELAPENPWQEYPRPQFQRDAWTNLNGLWDYTIQDGEASETPAEWDGKILVPFAPEAALSGVGRLVEPNQTLWYQRSFELEKRPNERVLLNFEAVDYDATVFVNGKRVGRHVGGNTPFSFDITDAAKDGENQLIVRAKDETGGFQLRGKQRLDPQGIWYTRVTGIWQTVWLEQVPERHITSVKTKPRIHEGSLRVLPTLAGEPLEGEQLRVTAYEGDTPVATAGSDLMLRFDNPKLWSPEEPNLYDLTIELLDGDGNVVDKVQSYAGLRKVGTARDDEGHLRLTLNDEIVFQFGPLDQGWWPDGLLTPPSDEAMQFEINFLKEAGFNMLRKHIKIEPRRYYTHCDRVGILVWQDQPSGGPFPEWTRMAPNPPEGDWPEEQHQQYLTELREMISALRNHPSIVSWVPFNERWGQHRTMDVGRWVRSYDPTRIINIASGGNFFQVGHVADHHNYPEPDFPIDDPRFDDYVKVIGEFGGHGWPVEGHLWNPDMRNWGYGDLPKTQEEYQQRYANSIEKLKEFKEKGIAAGVYTQTTDVEGEVNGLMTYDREVIKIPVEKLNAINSQLYD